MHCRAGKDIITTTSFYTVCRSINAFGGLAQGGKSFFQSLAYVDALRWFVRGFLSVFLGYFQVLKGKQAF